jgi:hypothetical protein
MRTSLDYDAKIWIDEALCNDKAAYYRIKMYPKRGKSVSVYPRKEKGAGKKPTPTI